MSLAWAAYRTVVPLLGAAAPAARMFASPAERPLWSERLGHVAARSGATDAWIHAASMGEALAVGPLVRELESLAPRACFQLTATTRGGRARLASLGPPYGLAPLDAPQPVRRFLAGVRPRRLVLIETELWPHWLLAARDARLPVAVVSARMSRRSVERYARFGGSFRSLIGGLAAVLCQSDADRERWIAAGAPSDRSDVVGNLKTDALPEPAADRPGERETLGLDRMRPLLVLGNVRPGELRALAPAWRGLPAAIHDRWQVAAVPRHPRASAELRAEAAAAGLTLRFAGDPQRPDAWLWDDRLGMLPRYYAVADVAIVGGTFAPWGGHNPLEPAACGAAVIVGPHHGHQLEGVRTLVAAGGARVTTDAATLARALIELLGDDDARLRCAAAGFAAVAGARGATRRAVARLATWGVWPAT
jgi:3-deoxy-D-manno-octulosonic-acid transferase